MRNMLAILRDDPEELREIARKQLRTKNVTAGNIYGRVERKVIADQKKFEDHFPKSMQAKPSRLR